MNCTGSYQTDDSCPVWHEHHHCVMSMGHNTIHECDCGATW